MHVKYIKKAPISITGASIKLVRLNTRQQGKNFTLMSLSG